MNDGEMTIDKRDTQAASGSLRKREEFRSWFFLTIVMAPVLAVLIVSGFGFLVWMYQLAAGPPGM